MTYDQLVEKYSLTFDSVFVPFSVSRNKDLSWKSLNWIVKVKSKGAEFLSCDYSSGVAHCPSYNWSDKYLREVAIELEIESGRPSRKGYGDKVFTAKKPFIQPNFKDILYSLTMDSDVLNYADFKDWAESLGYNSDSIKVKEIYDSCLETTLKLRAHLGESFLSDAAIVFEDY